MKKFLLIAGDYYYPQSSTGNWIGCFASSKEAESFIKKEQVHEYFSKGPRKGQIKETREIFFVNGVERDWYEIVDLEQWMSK